MKNSPNDESFIPEIHNYCDRWCERCAFTQRCRVFAMEQESPDDGADIETIVQNLTGIFAEAKQMLIEKADELGIDPFAITDEEFAEIRRREKEFVDGDELSHLADQYWCSAKEILDGDLPRDEDSMDDILPVLEWYLFFIPVKIKCGLNGLLDHDGFEDASQMMDSQSYANGTVKIGLIAIERSLVAWNQLADAGFSERVWTVIDLLETIKAKLDERFPLARDFIRPGFDEIEMVM
jgi:hypothetical protein